MTRELLRAADGKGFVYEKTFSCGHKQAFYFHKSEVVYGGGRTPTVSPTKDRSLKCRACAAIAK